MWGNHIQTVHLHFGTLLTTTPLGGLRFVLLKASDPEQEKTMQKPGKLSCKLSKKNNNKKKKRNDRKKQHLNTQLNGHLENKTQT